MRFQLIDQILDVQAGQRLRAVKNLTLGEEYLADHFPTFPVMPGVMMLQALVEAGAWLLRVTEDFRPTVVALREAKNVKYGSFLEPGRQMVVEVDLRSSDGTTAVLRGKGECEGKATVSAQIVLARYCLADREPALADTDERLREHWRERYRWLSRWQSPTTSQG